MQFIGAERYFKTLISAYREKHDALYQPNYVPDCFPTQYHSMEIFKYFATFFSSCCFLKNSKVFQVISSESRTFEKRVTEQLRVIEENIAVNLPKRFQDYSDSRFNQGS